jgi:hypothetical protein
MEFSSGIFTNLSIETQREVVQSKTDKGVSTPTDRDVPQLEVVAFTVKCNYGSKAQAAAAANSASNQVAMKK